MLFGPDFHEIVLDFDGVGVLGEAEASGDSSAMGVDDDSGHAEGRAEDDVRGLSSDARESYEFVEGVGNLPPVPPFFPTFNHGAIRGVQQNMLVIGNGPLDERYRRYLAIFLPSLDSGKGHRSRRVHSEHFGERDSHIARPW